MFGQHISFFSPLLYSWLGLNHVLISYMLDETWDLNISFSFVSLYSIPGWALIRSKSTTCWMKLGFKLKNYKKNYGSNKKSLNLWLNWIGIKKFERKKRIKKLHGSYITRANMWGGRWGWGDTCNLLYDLMVVFFGTVTTVLSIFSSLGSACWR